MLDDNLGIEINEMMAHSTYMIKNPYYHSEKTRKVREKGVRLIHIWEWEMVDEDVWGRTSGWVLDILSKSRERLFARKCRLQLVPVDKEKEFLRNYHLQGYRKSEICLGLYYDNELIQLISFCKSRFNPNYEWELLRLCTRFGFSVVGGPNRLLENFITNNHPESIISYCDLSKFTGDIYSKIGSPFSELTRQAQSGTTRCLAENSHNNPW